MKHLWFYDYPIGPLGIAEEGGAITNIYFGRGQANPGVEMAETPLIQAAAEQLAEYFGGARTQFDLPLNPRGTAFQRAVWDALRAIPAGETRSYKDIAAMVGAPLAYRAVGMANHCNPIPILIPCHRVIGHGGALTGYAGGLAMKRALLDLEKNH